MVSERNNFKDVSKAITLTLTDAEYRELMLLYHLGHLVRDSITQKSRAQMVQDFEFMQKLSRQGKESGSKHVFTAEGINGITQEIENEMLEIFEGFKEYIESGEDTAETERIRRDN
ncbi:MAG: hypothetical protein A3G23_02530 [Bacteroidetes bacterium RIFCSPLOWO2_12_FULL_37_12]|nr:MAG: hypothetical protein A3G23_02530 [Bacteroidetes bacterium RIFCSPLOWO2_12_FULL_37_12]